MIYKIAIKDPTQTPVEWLQQVDAFKNPREVAFKPGLNILWGRNGSGKTSLTKVLARLFHCAQGGQPYITRESMIELFGHRSANIDLQKGLEVTHDGQGVRYFDPGNTPGLMCNGTVFDWDFSAEGMRNVLFKGSAGQTTMFRFEQLLAEILAEKVPKVTWKIPRANLNSSQDQRVKLAAFFLEGNSGKGQPTILLDEPERSYDLNAQVGVWRFLRAYADRAQFIVASHSLFALKIPGAYYIELSPRYLSESEDMLEVLRGWPAEDPKKPSANVVERAHACVKKRKETP